jgi:type II secretory pathway component GspD/PulD (secretin)
LRKNEKKFSDKQIPFLGHVPLIGSLLFKQVDRDDQLTELVIFITPHIVKGDEFVTGDETKLQLGFRDYAPLLSNQPSSGER